MGKPKIGKEIFISVIGFSMMILLGWIGLSISYFIPTTLMQRNLNESALLFAHEGTYPQTILGKPDSQLDNWTDALMLLIAGYESTDAPFQDSLRNSYIQIEDMTPAESFGELYSVGGDQETSSEVKAYSYSRYWHGYLIFLKPLLCIMDYGAIRYLMFAVQLCMLLCLSVRLTQCGREVYVFPIVAAYLFLNPVSVGFSMQLAAVTNLVFAQLLLMLFMEKQYRESPYLLCLHFLIFGGLTNYFDLLTYPLAAFGIPIIFYMSFDKKQQTCSLVLKVVSTALAWSAGYAGMWAGKWGLATLITGTDVVGDALSQAKLRAAYAANDISFSYKDILHSIGNSINWFTVGVTLVFAVLLITYFAIRKKFVAQNSLFVYLLAASMPFIWYAVLGNHSYWHPWYTYRELAISLYAGYSYIAVCIFQTDTLKKGKETINRKGLLNG